MPKGDPNVYDRRRFFVEHVIIGRKKLYLKDVHAAFPNTNNQSILDDVEHLNKLGFSIESVRDGRKTVFEDRAGSRTILTDLRRGKNVTQKNIVAAVSGGIICGFSSDLKYPVLGKR